GAPTGALMLLSRLRGATSALVRRGASHDAGRSPLGAPPWRFSAGGRASISGIASGSVQRAPRSQVVVPGGRCPGPPEPAVTSRGRRTPLPAPPFRIVSRRRPSMSEDGNLCTINSLRSQDKSHKVADKITRFRPCAGGRSIHLSSQSVAEDVAIGARFDVAAEAVFQLGAVEGGLLEL